MAGRRTHYDVLGVARDASSVDIASAFRDKLADMKAKPDVLPEAIEALREAYQTLANPARRDEYDQSIAPPVIARAPRSRAPRETGDEPRGWASSAVRYGIPIVIVAVAFWGWKRQKAPKPEATIVSVTRMVTEDGGGGAGASARAGTVALPPMPAGARSAEQVFAEVSASIVRVLVSDSGGQLVKQGSGVVTGRGRVITNCHVTKDGARIAVKSGAANLSASVNVADEEFDLCSLDVSGLDAPAVTLGSVAAVRTGQRVYAIGAPLGLELTISEGIVSSLREAAGSKLIQTTAPVSPGSSGGGLFNTDGKLVGIVTFQHRNGQNLNFAVPVDWIAEMRNRSPINAAGASSSLPEAPPARATEVSTEEMVVGRWWCFGSISGRNAEYTYGGDGVLRIASPDGRAVAGRYRVSGRRITYQGSEGSFTLDIDSISADRMVQVVGDGHRLACERR